MTTPLQSGDIIQIGNTHLAFVHDLTQAFPDTSTLLKSSKAVDAEDGDGFSDDDSIFEAYEPTTITHRKEQSRFLDTPFARRYG